MVAFLEEQYGITLEEGELIPDNLDSIDKILAFLSRKIELGQGRSEVPTADLAA